MSWTSFFSLFSFVIFSYFPKLAKTKIAKKGNFHNFFAKNSQKFCKNPWFLRVRKCSKSSEITEIFPKFKKTAISKTRENKNFGKKRLTQGLKFCRSSTWPSFSSLVWKNCRRRLIYSFSRLNLYSSLNWCRMLLLALSLFPEIIFKVASFSFYSYIPS